MHLIYSHPFWAYCRQTTFAAAIVSHVVLIVNRVASVRVSIDMLPAHCLTFCCGRRAVSCLKHRALLRCEPDLSLLWVILQSLRLNRDSRSNEKRSPGRRSRPPAASAAVRALVLAPHLAKWPLHRGWRNGR